LKRQSLFILIGIVVLGFGLRIVGANVEIFDDEADWLVLINSISINRSFVNLPLAGVGHSPLSIYLTKLSSLLFGTTPFGYRFLNILLDTFTILLVFRLVHYALGEKEGIFAAFLTSINCFIIYYSREIGSDGGVLFFGTLVTYFFFKATQTKRVHYLLLWGFCMGLAILNKITILLLFPGFMIYLLLDKDRRKLFGDRNLYFSLLISIFLISPYLFWLYAHQWSHIGMRTDYIQFLNQPMSFLVFFGSIFKIGIYPHVNSFGREYMSLGMGLLLILGTIFTLKRFKNNNFIQLMQCIFWSIIGISILFYRAWPVHYNVCIIPAIALTASILSSIWKRQQFLKILIITFFSIHLLLLPYYLEKIRKSYPLQETYNEWLNTSMHFPKQ